jgi:hypothetical protein
MPLPVTSGLITQFDAGTIGQGDNTAVASWTPAAGTETAAAAQATAGQRPTFRTDQVNGLPAVVFTVAGQSNLDTGAWGASYATPNTGFVVAKQTTGGVGSAGNFFTGRSGVLNYIGLENAAINIGAGAGNQLTLAHTPDSNFHIFGAVYNGASSAIYRDTAIAGATGSTGLGTGADNMPGMRMGCTSASNTTNNFDGAIAEIVFYDSALTGGEIFSVMSYLNAKYGLALPGLDIRRKQPPQPYTSRRRAATW